MPQKSSAASSASLGTSLETAEFRRGPGGRPTREEAERRHRALLDAATQLFLEGGLNGTSIDAIAERAGVAKRFIYARYADKGELFVAAVGRFVEERLSPLLNLDLPDVPA
jgi:TetR/AcrR family transcriptional regulator, mexJK operon transcriptional repressor